MLIVWQTDYKYCLQRGFITWFYQTPNHLEDELMECLHEGISFSTCLHPTGQQHKHIVEQFEMIGRIDEFQLRFWLIATWLLHSHCSEQSHDPYCSARCHPGTLLYRGDKTGKELADDGFSYFQRVQHAVQGRPGSGLEKNILRDTARRKG